jgi:predicted flap endonuclease-1-like 5' DNA nuclease
VLGKELVDPQRTGCTLQLVERGVAFVQADRVAEVVEDRQQFAKPPDAALVQGFAGAAPLAPKPLQRSGIGPVVPLPMAPACVLHFKQIAAVRAPEVGSSLRACDARAASETTQSVQIVVHALVLA